MKINTKQASSRKKPDFVTCKTKKQISTLNILNYGHHSITEKIIMLAEAIQQGFYTRKKG